MKPKKFKFKLQKFLDMKRQEEEDQKKVFAEAMKRLQREQEKLQQLINLREYKKQEMKMKMLQGALDAFEMRMYAEYIEALKHKIQEQREVVRKAEEILDKEREKLKQIMAERKAFEKLKERAYEKFLQEQELEERKLIDELATIKFARKFLEEQREREGGENS